MFLLALFKFWKTKRPVSHLAGPALFVWAAVSAAAEIQIQGCVLHVSFCFRFLISCHSSAVDKQKMAAL